MSKRVKKSSINRTAFLFIIILGLSTLLLYIAQKSIQVAQDNRKHAAELTDIPNPSRYVPLTGSWFEKGSAQRLGLYDHKTGTFFLSTAPTITSTQTLMTPFSFGKTGTTITPFMGDWDGNGTFTPGIYDDDTALFTFTNEIGLEKPATSFAYGNPHFGMIPLIGDWDGDKKTDVGLYDQLNGTFLLRTERTTGPATISFLYGKPGKAYIPFSGDWDGDGRDGVALFDIAIGRALLKNQLTTGFADKDVQTPYFLLWDTVTPFAIKSNPRDNISYVGFYYAVNNTFYISDNKTFADAKKTTLCPPQPLTMEAEHQLSYFGYYGVSGTSEDGHKSYVSEIAALGNSNVAQISPLDMAATKQQLDELGNANMQAILSLEQFFFRRDEAGFPVLLDEYKDNVNTLMNTIGLSRKNIYAFYFDEPFANRISAYDFSLLTNALKQASPNTRIMISEAPGTIINGIIPSSYLTNVTDVAFDYYINDQVEYPNATRTCTTTLLNAAKDLPVERLWFVQQGYASGSRAINQSTEDLKYTYNLSRKTQKIVGILSFIYPDVSIIKELSVKEIFELKRSQFASDYKTTHLNIGKSIIRR